MNGPTAASPPPQPPSMGGGVGGGGGAVPPFNAMMMNGPPPLSMPAGHQQQLLQHHMQQQQQHNNNNNNNASGSSNVNGNHPQAQYMPHPGAMGMGPSNQQHISPAALAAMMQQQQQQQQQQQFANLPPQLQHQFQQQQQQQPPTNQMLAQMNSMMNGQPGAGQTSLQMHMQNNPAFRAAAVAAAQAQAQGKPFNPEDQKRLAQAQVHPSQMQAFLAAQAQAQAQMQQAAGAGASAGAGANHQSPQHPSPSHRPMQQPLMHTQQPPSQQQQQQQQQQQMHHMSPPHPQGMQLPGQAGRRTPTAGSATAPGASNTTTIAGGAVGVRPPHLPQHLLASAGSMSSPGSSQPIPQHLQQRQQMHLQQQQQHMPQQPPPLNHHPQQQLSQQAQLQLQAQQLHHGMLSHPDAEQLPAGAIAGPSSHRGLHSRRPSIDQIALMQRLSQMAQKGGLPIQTLFTKTSWIASSDEGEKIPDFTLWDKRNMEEWMQKDLRSMELVKREKMRAREVLEDMVQEIVTAQDWLGPARGGSDYLPGQHSQPPQPNLHVRSRKEMERDLAKGKRKRRPWLEFSRKQLRNVAKQEECLIPIRLDLEHEGRKCSDTFTWNLNDTLITPATFADVMCEDLLLPHEQFHSLIVNAINEQVKQYQEAEEAHPRSLFLGSASSSSSSDNNNNNSNTLAAGEQENDGLHNGSGSGRLELPPSASRTRDQQQKSSDLLRSHEADHRNDDVGVDVDVNGDEDEGEGEDWWDTWRKKVKLTQSLDVGEEVKGIDWHEGADAQDDLEKLGTAIPIIVHGHDELRITIHLDVAVDNLNLRDQFEWDLADPQNCPEDFAAVYCADLGLPGEFRTAISHLIREQLDAYARSLSSVRHIKGDQILHEELRPAFHPTLQEAVRSDDVENWTPHLGKLDLVELEHRERERERQSRRQKRGARSNNRRNVVTLPEREPLRTSRTIMPKPGAVLEVPEHTVPDDPMSVPYYNIAIAYPLAPVKSQGPPPTLNSPLRKTSRKTTNDAGAAAAAKGDIAVAPVGIKKGPPGKKRGRVPLDSVGATPPPGAVASANGSPAPGAVPPPVEVNTRPLQIKKPPGWTRIEMTSHDNIIDGKWHCTNCGVPEPIAVGRRKGPAGPNTQCAECGKYFMSNKGRLRPCEYTTDPAWHQARQLGAMNQGLPGPSTRYASQAPPTPAVVAPDSPGGSVFEPESGDESKPSIGDDSFTSSIPPSRGGHPYPVQAAGKTLPFVKPHTGGGGKGKGKGKGAGKGAGKGLPPFPKKKSHTPQPDHSAIPKDFQPHLHLHPHQQSLPPIRLSPNRANSQSAASASPPALQGTPPSSRPVAPPRKRPDTPQWMLEEFAKLQREKPDDRFEIICKPRSSPEEPVEWRLKCLDCPGKVYKTGPDQTLDNFSSHLRFKGHRMAVAARLGQA